MNYKIYLILFFLLVVGCNRQAKHRLEPLSNNELLLRYEGKTMVEIQKDVLDRLDPMRSRYNIADQKVAALEKKVEKASGRLLYNNLFKLAKALLNEGASRKAIEVTQRLMKEVDFEKYELNFDLLAVRKLEALAYFRLGEQENCIINHNEYSCLYPIQEPAFYEQREYTEKALELYTNLITEGNEDIRMVWMLNMAYMTLGKHPDEVPKEYLINPYDTLSNIDFPRFKEVASAMGLGVNGTAGGVVADDFDNDKDIDLLMSTYDPRDSLILMINNGDGTFSDQSKKSGVSDVMSGLNLLQADYNNDGFVDVLVLRGGWESRQERYPNSLIRNNGDGTFTDVTIESGLLSFYQTQTATWADFNRDGCLDLFIANESSEEAKEPCELFINQCDGTFQNVTKMAGIDINGYFKGTVSGDYNGDGWPDIYVSNYNGQNYLLRNEGLNEAKEIHFSDQTAVAGVEAPYRSFTSWFWDVDQDGWEDLYVSNYAFETNYLVIEEYMGKETDMKVQSRFYRNNGDGTFSIMNDPLNLDGVVCAMGGNTGDLNNDGWPDFYGGTGTPDYADIYPNRMFLNQQGSSFLEVTYAGGFGHLQKGHGVAFADLDNDGDQDVYSVMGGSFYGDVFPNALFENPGFNNNWIKIRLEGISSNRSAIGAKIRIVCTQEGKNEWHRTVSSGGSFGCNPLMQELGLGSATSIDTLEILWPAGLKQQFTSIAANHRIYIQEGVNSILVETQAPFQFDTSKGHHHHSM